MHGQWVDWERMVWQRVTDARSSDPRARRWRPRPVLDDIFVTGLADLLLAALTSGHAGQENCSDAQLASGKDVARAIHEMLLRKNLVE
jgi:hypothetical protein